MYYVRYTISHSLFTSVHYSGSYTGRIAVVAKLFPTRVNTSCGDLYLLYLCIYVSYILLIYILLISWQYGDCQ